MNKDNIFEIFRTLMAIVISLILAFIIIFFISKQPYVALSKFLLGPLSKTRYFSNVLEMAIPLTFTGLAICIMFKANQFNLGAEGAFFMGAVTATIIGIKFSLPGLIHPILAIVCGGIIGGIFLFIPAFLKVKWNANELVSSLMLNYVMFYLGIYIVNYYLRDSNAGAMVSYKLKTTALLPNLIPKTRLHYGILIAILMIIITYFFLFRTKWGYAIRMVGFNSKFAIYSGINNKSVILYSQIIGGIIAGIGGATELLGMYSRFQWQNLPGYGWDGVIVAILSRNNPVLVPIAAFFLSYLRIGADLMARITDVPSEVVSVIQALVIMLVAAESFLAKWKHRVIAKKAIEEIKAEEVNMNEQYI
ncbi:ABC transporter permease [Caloramator proteoclasticus]|uniref:Simple sugar transport system permease protein n=1 Tax=Caloramator proteoclasticus DSM 10124 TaxID=1121262 RepID=A0A1M5A0V3_9CLOT|nr:ABC transporter permease [Caloramator proteoclasticus]SHF23747.1 simple sugar transport system permease protein [Caloramator proteoclasticus DSM 10124]